MLLCVIDPKETKRTTPKLSIIHYPLFQEVLDNLFQFRFRRSADHFAGLGIGFQEEEGGDAADAQALADVLSSIDIDFVDNQLTFVFSSKLFRDGFQLHARLAPVGVEIDDAGGGTFVAESEFGVDVGDAFPELFGSEGDDFAGEVFCLSRRRVLLTRIQMVVAVFGSLCLGLFLCALIGLLSAGAEQQRQAEDGEEVFFHYLYIIVFIFVICFVLPHIAFLRRLCGVNCMNLIFYYKSIFYT